MTAAAGGADNKRAGRGLKFCPETNDLLYPRENKEARRLEYYCKNCTHVEPAAKEVRWWLRRSLAAEPHSQSRMAACILGTTSALGMGAAAAA